MVLWEPLGCGSEAAGKISIPTQKHNRVTPSSQLGSISKRNSLISSVCLKLSLIVYIIGAMLSNYNAFKQFRQEAIFSKSTFSHPYCHPTKATHWLQYVFLTVFASFYILFTWNIYLYTDINIPCSTIHVIPCFSLRAYLHLSTC